MGRRQLDQWQAAIDRARALPERELPQPAAAYTGPPPPRAWADKDPEAAARLSAARAAVTALAEELNLPQENLITPDTVRRLCWAPPAEPTPEAVAVRPGRAGRPPLADRADHAAAHQGPHRPPAGGPAAASRPLTPYPAVRM